MADRKLKDDAEKKQDRKDDAEKKRELSDEELADEALAKAERERADAEQAMRLRLYQQLRHDGHQVHITEMGRYVDIVRSAEE